MATEELAHALNRVAGTLYLDAQGAANVWAGTTGKDLLGALNAKAGTSGLGLLRVLNRLAGTTNLGVNAAAAALFNGAAPVPARTRFTGTTLTAT